MPKLSPGLSLDNLSSTVFLTFQPKILHDVNNTIMKYFCKLRVDMPINASLRVTAVQSLENLYTSVLRQPCVGAHLPI